MSMLNRLFNRDSGADTPGDAAGAAMQECPHVALTPRWDRVDDMGHEDLATSFVCDSCHQTLTPDEARAVRADMGNRLHLD